jgi:GAF domain-containing protein
MTEELAILELLVREESTDQFEAIVTAARNNGVTGARLAELERAKQLGLTVRAQADRRQQREAALTALVDTARELAGLHDLDTLLNATSRRARLLLRTDMAYVSLPDEQRGDVYVRAADGHTSTLSVGLRLPAIGGVGSVILSDSGPFWTPDYLADERFAHNTKIDEVVRTEGLHAIMAVPLARGAKTFGVLYVADRNVRHFKVDEISLLSAFADLASVMIDAAHHVEQATTEAAHLRGRAASAEGALHRRTELAQTHDDLIDLVLGGGDVRALAEEASRRLDGAVRLCGRDGRVLAEAGDMPDGADAILVATMDAHAAKEPVPLEGGMWATPVFAGNEHLGTLLHCPEEPLTDLTTKLLQLVTQTAAVLLLLDSRATSAEASTRGELLDDLLADPPRPPQVLAKRARRLGVDLGAEHVVILARSDGMTYAKGAVWASSYAHHMGGLSTVKNGCNVLLLPGADPGAAARTVYRKLSPLLGQPVTVSGAGPVSDPGSVVHGFLEALRCLDAMTVIGAEGRAASVSELGFLGVLLSDSPDVDGFVEAAIGPVLDYDRQRSTELVRTLDAYFETGGSPTYSAERLHVHPNTVARRLERVNELLGPGWQQSERSLDIQLALRLFRLRHLLGSRPASSDA